MGDAPGQVKLQSSHSRFQTSTLLTEEKFASSQSGSPKDSETSKTEEEDDEKDGDQEPRRLPPRTGWRCGCRATEEAVKLPQPTTQPPLQSTVAAAGIFGLASLATSTLSALASRPPVITTTTMRPDLAEPEEPDSALTNIWAGIAAAAASLAVCGTRNRASSSSIIHSIYTSAARVCRTDGCRP